MTSKRRLAQKARAEERRQDRLARRAAIVAEVESGARVADVAQRHGVTTVRIQQIAKQHGLACGWYRPGATPTPLTVTPADVRTLRRVADAMRRDAGLLDDLAARIDRALPP